MVAFGLAFCLTAYIGCRGLAAYAAGSLAALVVPGIPPVNGIAVAYLVYACLIRSR